MDSPFGDGRIRRLDRELRKAAVPEPVVTQIMAGGEDIGAHDTNRRKAAWFQGAMARLDDLLDADTVRTVREGCACCLGGKRLALSKAIAREHATFDARLAAANETPFVFGRSVTQEPDGRLLVRFEDEGKPGYRCVCLREPDGPISAGYCLCCGGHIKHHLQIALGRKLAGEVRSSALASAGREPCSFLYTLIEEPT